MSTWLKDPRWERIKELADRLSTQGHACRSRIRGNGHPGSPREYLATCECGWTTAWLPLQEGRREVLEHYEKVASR